MSFAFLIQMSWKSALIAGAALIVLRLLRSRSAADRAAMLQLAVAMLLALPLIALLAPALEVTSPLPTPAEVAPVPAPPAAFAAPTSATVGIEAAPAPSPAAHLSVAGLVAATYLTGVVLLLARMAAGLVTLTRWSRQSQHVAEPEWAAALARVRSAARVRRRIRLAVSDRIGSPLSWGLLRPVILIDRSSLARAEDIDAILAHETAHVARHDWAVLMLARLALVLFWFNPLVWRLERSLVQAAEEAADRAAIDRVEPLAYASTLVACVRHAGKAGWALPANGMAPRRALKARVEAILDPEQCGRPSGSMITAAAMLLCVAVAGPVAALEVVQSRPLAPTSPRPTAAAAVPPRAPVHPARAVPDAGAARTARHVDVTPSPNPVPNPEPAPAWEAALDREIERAIAGTEVRIPEIRVPEIRIPDVRIPAVTIPEQRLRIPPVDREAVREAARAGREAAREGREAMRDARDAERERLHDARQAQRDRLDDAREAQRERLAAEQIFGITPERKQAYAQLGYPNLAQKQLVAMAIHGVTPGFIHDMADAGYPGLSADLLVQMRIFGVTPAVARRAVQRQGRPPPEDLIKMKIFGAL